MLFEHIFVICFQPKNRFELPKLLQAILDVYSSCNSEGQYSNRLLTFSTLILYHVSYFVDISCPPQCKFSCIGASETPCSFLTHNAFRKINCIFPARSQGNTYWKVCHYTNYIINFQYTVQITRLETARNFSCIVVCKMQRRMWWSAIYYFMSKINHSMAGIYRGNYAKLNFIFIIIPYLSVFSYKNIRYKDTTNR